MLLIVTRRYPDTGPPARRRLGGPWSPLSFEIQAHRKPYTATNERVQEFRTGQRPRSDGPAWALAAFADDGGDFACHRRSGECRTRLPTAAAIDARRTGFADCCAGRVRGRP